MSFLTPLFWMGLAAAAVPIIVHLVRRTRAPRVEFPSLMFVRKIPQQTIRRRRLRNLLLLLLRCLAVMLLVFAFVRPFIRTSRAGMYGASGVEVILLDRSFSMRYENRFEQARTRARQLIDERSTTELALVLFDEGYEVVTPPTADRGLLKTRLAGLTPGFGASDLDQALRGAESLLRRHPTGRGTIHLLTDFQATGRRANAAPYEAAAGIKLVPYNPAYNSRVPAGGNLAPTELIGVGTIYQPKYADPLTAQITNFGPERADRVQIEFRLNDRPVEKREVAIPARESRAVEFTGFNLNEGINQGALLIAGDSFDGDNRYEFLLRRQARSKALVIGSASGGGRGENLYLRNALTAGENNPFELELRTPNRTSSAELREQRLVIIDDTSLPAGLASELIRQVEGGAGLIVALGPRTDRESFNAAFGARLGMVSGDPVVRRGDGVTLSGINGEHPVFEPFRRTGRQPTARIRAYREVAPAAGTTVLARYDDGAPAMIESTIGRGRVLLLTTTLDLTWNDLALTPFYLPVLRQMARHLLGVEPALALTVGETIAIDTTAEGELPAIDTPAGVRLPRPTTGPTGAAIVATEPGLYRLRYPDRTDLIAVNIDARESDFTVLDADQVIAAMTGRGGVTDGRQSAANTSPTSSAEDEGPEVIEDRQRLWFYLLIAALLLFITEGLLARRIRVAKLIN